jgi:glucose dehydrogenase
MWRAFVSSIESVSCCVDDRFLYVMNADEELHALDKRNGAILWSATSGVAVYNRAIDCDGMHLYTPSSTIGRSRILHRGRTSQVFVRVDETDTHRRPFYKLAVPATEQ